MGAAYAEAGFALQAGGFRKTGFGQDKEKPFGRRSSGKFQAPWASFWVKFPGG
jgi:hypothetical protein